jgi:zinc/manganese transport system permease protein
MWAGLAAAAWIPQCPPSFSIMAAATLVYAATYLRRPAARPTEPVTA